MTKQELRALIREEIQNQVNEARLIDLKNLVPKMIVSAFGPKTDTSMRKEMQSEIEKAIAPILVKYDYIVK